MKARYERTYSFVSQIIKQDWCSYLAGEDKVKNIPTYVTRAKELREKLSKIKPETLPLKFNSIEDLFSQANKTANYIWLDTAFQFIYADLDKAFEKTKKIKNNKLPLVLKEKNKLRKALEKNKFFKLEGLNNPPFIDLWKEVLMFASEKEQLKLNLVEGWMNELPDDAFESFGITKQELYFILDMQKSIQPLVDYAFIKQIGLEDNIESTEIHKITENLRIFSAKMKNSQFFKKHLIYQGFPKYLIQIAEAFESKEIDPIKLHEIWNKVDEAAVNLAKSGCPIIINCHSKNTEKQDELEFSIQIRTKEALQLESLADPYYKKAKSLSPDKSIPPVIVGFNISNSGVNLYYQTLGVARTKMTSIHSDQLERDREGKVVLSNFFTTLAHELGHQIIVDNIDDAFDEIKADLLGIFIDYLLKKEDNKKVNTVPIDQYMRELVYGYTEEMITSSGYEGLSSDHYSLLGRFLVSFFAIKNIIYIRGGVIEINTKKLDPFTELIKIGADILDICEKPGFSKTEAKEFFNTRIKPIINEAILKPYIKIFQGNNHGN